MGIVLDIIVVAILTLCIFLGYRRGLVKVAFSLFAFIASLLISIILYWPITNFVINNTQIDENIEAIIVKNTNEEETQENTGISTYVQNYAENMVSETQDAVVETAARAIAINIVGIGVMILIFVVTRLLLILLGSVANIISNLPIIKQFNEIGGIIYGILKAGGTYLPILPEYPKERIEYLLIDSGAKILLVSHSDLIGMNIIPTICVHEEMKNVSNNPKYKIDVESAVYIIYTSGTTGEPKGVVISNRNLQNLVTWQLKEGNISENSRILQNFTYVFDGSVWEIFCSGLSGACLQLISDEDQKNAKNLLEIIYNKRISHMLIVPSMLRIITDYVQKNNLGFMFQHIKRLYIGGESLDKKLVEWFCESSGVDEEKLCNLYGPTEITVCATYSQIRKGGNITIGKPIGNTQALVMQQGNICGVGMLGELCIGGEGVSQGYLNREELTREKFVVLDLNGNRLYRSGDLVRKISSD